MSLPRRLSPENTWPGAGKKAGTPLHVEMLPCGLLLSKLRPAGVYTLGRRLFSQLLCATGTSPLGRSGLPLRNQISLKTKVI